MYALCHHFYSHIPCIVKSSSDFQVWAPYEASMVVFRLKSFSLWSLEDPAVFNSNTATIWGHDPNDAGRHALVCKKSHGILTILYLLWHVTCLLPTTPTDGLVVCHLPYGPTASFSISNTVMRHDIPDVGTMSEAFPHLIFHNFKTKLGQRVS